MTGFPAIDSGEKLQHFINSFQGIGEMPDVEIGKIGEFLKEAVFAEETAALPGLLQGIDPRMKLATVLMLLIVTLFTHILAVLPADPVGIPGIQGLQITPDAHAYTYSVTRKLSELYLVDGLR